MGYGDVVSSTVEREAAFSVLLHACTRLSELHATGGVGSEEQQVMYSHMADMLGKWLLAGPHGKLSITHDAGLAPVLRHMPGSSLSFHEIISRA